MSRAVANVNILSDTFENWLLSTNELLHSLSTEILTANSTVADTGNATISRTAQLWGTFGTNNVIVTNQLRGGNVNGSYTDLTVSTNVSISNTSLANLQVRISNSSSVTYINPLGGYFGSTSSNSVVNTSSIIIQSSATVNSVLIPTSLKISNLTTNSTMTSVSFVTGNTVVNTVIIQLGANVVLTPSSLTIGNSTVNTYITAATIDTDGTLAVLGAATLSNTLGVTGATTLSNTLGVTGLSSLNGGMNTTTGNASIAFNVGANVNLTVDKINVGNSTVNSYITAATIETDGTLAVLGTATLSNTLTVAGLSSLNGAMNTTTANASVAVNIGANVNLTTARINVGNSTVNSYITSTAIETDGTLAVLGAATLSNTLGVTGATTLSNTVGVTGLSSLNGGMNTTTANASVGVNIGSNVVITTSSLTVGNSTVNSAITSTTIATDGTLDVASTATIGGAVTIETDYVIDVNSIANVGDNTLPRTIFSFPAATYSSGKFTVQIKNSGNTQISEMVLAHNLTTAYVTTYGTVSSPQAANGSVSLLGTFAANVNGSNVDLLINQVISNSAVKVVAHLIK